MRRTLLIPVLVGLLAAPLGALPASGADDASGKTPTATSGTNPDSGTHPDRVIAKQKPRLVKVTGPTGAGVQPAPAVRQGSAVIPGGDEVADGAAQLSALPGRALGQLGAPLATFDGMGGSNPNDTTGDVGPNHFVQAINSTFRVYDKTGTSLEGPTGLGQLWNDGDATTEACEQNAGDPVVLYDNLADRWMIAQFSRFAPFANVMCLAVSVTADPRLSQGYYAYTFDMGSFPDYLKIGAWTDGYYFSANGTGNALVAVFDRASMLNGVPAGAVQFTAVADLPNNGFNVLMPSDIDGATAPPAGSPGYFYRPVDGDNMGGGADRVELFTATVNWADPPASTLSAPTNIALVPFDMTVCGFLSFGCIPQPGTSGLLDPVNETGMFRFPYRNYGTREVLAGNFTVDTNAGGADRAGVRWFMLERIGGGAWGVADQGTFAPQPVGATAFVHRFMGSLAMDRFGNLALGYTRSSAANPTSPGGYTGFASAVYAGRAAGDPRGLLPQPEVVVQAGTGALGAGGALTRWGDYFTMVVDPIDDCTFWYTGDYATTIRQSRIVSFRFADCATDLRITKTVAPSQTGAGQEADYTITVHNDGAVGATDVVVTDALPAQVTYQSNTGSCSGVAVNATGTLTCALGNIAAGGSTSFQIKVRINENPGTTTITNTATVSGGPGETDPSDNSASVTHFVTGANLSLTKSDSPDPVIAGENLVYTLAVDNAGPQTADSAVVTDTLPPGVTFASAATTTGTATHSGGVVTWNLGNVDPAAPVRTLTVTVKVNPQTTGSLVNSAAVASDTADPDASNNLASSTTAVTAVANLTLTKSGSPEPVIAGSNLSYRLTLGNSGPSTAQDVVLTDRLPADVSFVSAVGGTGATACAEVTGTVSCEVGDLDPGQSIQRIITVKVRASLPAGVLSNTATASSPTDADGVEATATTGVITSADLWMEKSGTAPAGNPSGALVYRLTVHNETGSAPDSTPTSGAGGPSDAQTVVVVDTLPLTAKKLTVQFLSPGCTYSKTSHLVTCRAATIPAGSSVTFEIQVQISGSNGSLTNVATVSSATADPAGGNNTDSVNNVVQGGGGKPPRPR